MKKKKKRVWLYQKYLAEHKTADEIQEFKVNAGVEKDNIIINKVSTIGKILEIVRDVLFTVGKVAFWIIIMGILSIGGTVLLNEQLRSSFFDILQNVL